MNHQVETDGNRGRNSALCSFFLAHTILLLQPVRPSASFLQARHMFIHRSLHLRARSQSRGSDTSNECCVFYERSWRLLPILSILTLSTRHQRPQPRIIAWSFPSLRLIATTRPLGQAKRV